MTALLEAKVLKKTYGMGKVLVPALRRITFDAKEGEFVAVFYAQSFDWFLESEFQFSVGVIIHVFNVLVFSLMLNIEFLSAPLFLYLACCN